MKNTNPTTLHTRVLKLQKEMKALKDATYADHRILEQIYTQQKIHRKALDTMKKMLDAITTTLQDDNK